VHADNNINEAIRSSRSLRGELHRRVYDNSLAN
jgi:hypothetical protein